MGCGQTLWEDNRQLLNPSPSSFVSKSSRPAIMVPEKTLRR